MIKASLQRFVAFEASGGITLIFFAIVSLILNNSWLADGYQAILNTPMSIAVGEHQFSAVFTAWIDDGLMVLFFFFASLELKREMIEGHLASLSRALLPVAAAFGGMLGPALLYISFNRHDMIALQGWAVPVATDIAFALGVLSLLGARVPRGLKIFLTVLAIVDDIGAIAIIAFLHTEDLSLLPLCGAALIGLILILCNRRHVSFLPLYFFLGVLLWIGVLTSGIHATLSGVFLAMAIPIRDKAGRPLLARIEAALKYAVTYGVLPIFALANAGVSFTGLSIDDALSPIALGIIISLFFGKQIGVFLLTWLLVTLNYARLPSQVTWWHIYGVSLLCGIGFTMSLFMGGLAFKDDSPFYMTQVRLGVLLASLIAGLAGYSVLWLYARYQFFLKKDQGQTA